MPENRTLVLFDHLATQCWADVMTDLVFMEELAPRDGTGKIYIENNDIYFPLDRE